MLRLDHLQWRKQNESPPGSTALQQQCGGCYGVLWASSSWDPLRKGMLKQAETMLDPWWKLQLCSRKCFVTGDVTSCLLIVLLCSKIQNFNVILSFPHTSSLMDISAFQTLGFDSAKCCWNKEGPKVPAPAYIWWVEVLLWYICCVKTIMLICLSLHESHKSQKM